MEFESLHKFVKGKCTNMSSMKWIQASNYDEMSTIAANIVEQQLSERKDTVLGLATGSTPIGLYNKLVEKYKAGNISFNEAKSFNLDEYIGIDAENEASYHYFMDQYLFKHIDMKRENIYIPDGNIKQENAENYDIEIEKAGGVDLQLLGIGVNGHIGFNEPNTPFNAKTHIVELTESTREANKIHFSNPDDVPTHAITMGIGTIMIAKKVLLLISGKSKQEAYRQLRSGVVTEEFPASALHNHPDVTVIYTDVE